METKFKCIVCGKLTAGRMPRIPQFQGDTTARFPRRHNYKGKPCPGNILEAEWIDIPEQTKEAK